MQTLPASLIGNRNGTTFVAYGLIAGLIVLATVAAAASVGASLGGFVETGVHPVAIGSEA